jgi:hypothetical protein
MTRRVSSKRRDRAGKACWPSPRQIEPVCPLEETIAKDFRVDRGLAQRSIGINVDLVPEVDEPRDLVEDERLGDLGSVSYTQQTLPTIMLV